ncbi:sphingosine-1-phosphate lyase-like [Glossina fuscipes]|uniref:Sphingosine-1-phosphate lyase-like n=1 Tax=Glossina fuscipes TaxID=7396 RepID=A0A9C6DYH4_9MUSC|nr:sphingosine-1-phosphate lyase-like [Glossina fuscipes]
MVFMLSKIEVLITKCVTARNSITESSNSLEGRRAYYFNYLRSSTRAPLLHYIERGLRKIDGIFVFGQPTTSVIAIGSHLFDVFRLSDALCKVG